MDRANAILRLIRHDFGQAAAWIYCINWGFRLPRLGMNAERREEIAAMFWKDLAGLQFRGQGYRNGRVFDTYGIVYVPDPYEARAAQ